MESMRICPGHDGEGTLLAPGHCLTLGTGRNRYRGVVATVECCLLLLDVVFNVHSLLLFFNADQLHYKVNILILGYE